MGDPRGGCSGVVRRGVVSVNEKVTRRNARHGTTRQGMGVGGVGGGGGGGGGGPRVIEVVRHGFGAGLRKKCTPEPKQVKGGRVEGWI